MQQESFALNFEALTGFAPFRWQQRLYDDWLGAGKIPAALDIPTGLGKTAVIAVWLLAKRAGAPLPRRLVYVVDRRVVVDQATAEAEKIAARAGGGAGAIAVSTLRGQHLDNRRWLEGPAGLAIIVGTVDMIGSRLLFEGYRVNPDMRSFHAGLLGADSLVLLDEAHLCPPFERLLNSVRDTRPAKATLVPRFEIISLSATHVSTEPDAFKLESADTDAATQPIAHARYHAAKALHLHCLEGGQELTASLVRRAEALPLGRNVVFCNSRRVAQDVASELKKAKLGAVELLTGARRALEREKVREWLENQGYLPRADGSYAAPVGAFLVATAAGEVGVDLDADNMACDLVAFERMVQRLGRVNRRGGENRCAMVEVVCPKASDDEPPQPEQVQHAVMAALAVRSDGAYDASPAAIADLRAAQPGLVGAASSPEPLFPPLEAAQVDAWSMTSLRDHPGRPQPAPWIRGWEEATAEAEIEIIWRRWLPWRAGQPPLKQEVSDFFEAAPPHASEVLRIEASIAVKWLKARAARHVVLDGDPVEAGALLLSPGNEYAGYLTPAGVGGLEASELREKLVGSTLVVAAQFAGLDTSGLLDPAHTIPPACWDDGFEPTQLTAIGVQLLDGESEISADWREAGHFTWDDEGAHRRVIAVLRRAGAAREGNAAVARRDQALDEHVAWVAGAAADLAQRLALPDEYRRMLAVATKRHDEGKSRELWQDAMGAPRDAGRPYGKTTAGCSPARLRIGGLTYRHEFGSLAAAEAAAESDPDWLALPEALRELALHLIASHHGRARPVIAPVDPDEPPSSPRLRGRAVRAALRFAQLQEQWGHWGLAWWEAVFRAADQTASRRLDQPELAAAAQGV